MNKEEILKMSRQENKDKDIVALEAGTKASRHAIISGVTFALILWVWQAIAKSENNASIIALMMFFNMVMQFSIYFSLKRKQNLVAALCWTFSTIIYTAMAIMSFYN
jgi:asparagine N-glycosylation enzyme membrane subunit Stt3